MCDTCQDCNCDNITLPVATGPTGATGATGAAGADGADGVAVLHNDVTQSTTSSASIALFSSTKAYTLPSGTLATNGSKLILTALFSTTGNTIGSSSTAYIYIGGTSFTAKLHPYTLAYGTTAEAYLKIRLEISRISNTALFINSDSFMTDTTTAQTESFNFLENSVAVSDIDSNTLLIEARGKTTGTTTFNCDQLTIDHYVK